MTDHLRKALRDRIRNALEADRPRDIADKVNTFWQRAVRLPVTPAKKLAAEKIKELLQNTITIDAAADIATDFTLEAVREAQADTLRESKSD